MQTVLNLSFLQEEEEAAGGEVRENAMEVLSLPAEVGSGERNLEVTPVTGSQGLELRCGGLKAEFIESVKMGSANMKGSSGIREWKRDGSRNWDLDQVPVVYLCHGSSEPCLPLPLHSQVGIMPVLFLPSLGLGQRVPVSGCGRSQTPWPRAGPR